MPNMHALAYARQEDARLLYNLPYPGKENPMADQQVPSVGRIVHYVLPSGEHRPAIIVKVWHDTPDPGTSNLHVFLDKFEVGEQDLTSITRGDGPGHWHWPEYVPNKTT